MEGDRDTDMRMRPLGLFGCGLKGADYNRIYEVVAKLNPEDAAKLVYALSTVIHRLQCEGTFRLDRDPFALMPVVHAFDEGEISGGKVRECIRRWLGGEDFRDPASREWESERD